MIRLCWNPLESAYLFVQLCLLRYLTDSLFPADHVTLLSKKFVDWLRYASITQGGAATSGGFFAGPRSRQVSRTPWSIQIIQIINSCMMLKGCFIFVHMHSLPAGAHSRAGWDGVGRFLHCALCRPGLHRRPVDERLFLLHASPLASHLSLYFKQQ